MNVSDFDLRFAIETRSSGRVAMRYFRNPQDSDGIDIALTPQEAGQLARAVTTAGFHPIARDDAPDLQLALKFAA